MALPNPSDHRNPPHSNKMEEQNPPLNLTLAGKLLTSQRPNLATFKHRISRIWDFPNNLDVHDLGLGIYSFRFHRPQDRLRILEGGPWHYQDALILLSEHHHNTPPHQIHFTKAKLWVRIHELAAICVNPEYAEAIGARLGRHCQTDYPKEDDKPERRPSFLAMCKFMRVMVEIDLSKPLVPEIAMHVKHGDQVYDYQHPLSYERLPGDFCYVCGLIGHVYNYCSMFHLIQNNGGSLPYNEKIRAEKYYSLLNEQQLHQ